MCTAERTRADATLSSASLRSKSRCPDREPESSVPARPQGGVCIFVSRHPRSTWDLSDCKHTDTPYILDTLRHVTAYTSFPLHAHCPRHARTVLHAHMSPSMQQSMNPPTRGMHHCCMLLRVTLRLPCAHGWWWPLLIADGGGVRAQRFKISAFSGVSWKSVPGEPQAHALG